MPPCPGLDLGEVMDHSAQQLAPEVAAEKIVKDGIDHAVEEGETVDNIIEEVEQVDHVTVQGDVGPKQCEQ